VLKSGLWWVEVVSITNHLIGYASITLVCV